VVAASGAFAESSVEHARWLGNAAPADL